MFDQRLEHCPDVWPLAVQDLRREIIFIELMTSDCKLKASREGSK